MSLLFQVVDPVTLSKKAIPLEVAKAFNGIEDATKITPSYDPTTRTVTVTYSAGAAIWVGGIRYEKSGVETITHSAVIGKHFVYFNSSGTLVTSTTPWDLLTTAQLVSLYYQTATNPDIGLVLDERHPAMTGMDNATHSYLHRTRGTQAVSGMVASGYTLNTAGQAALSYSISSGVIADEDNYHAVSTLPDGGPYRIFYRNNDGTWIWLDTSITGILDDGTNIQYDSAGASRTGITSNNRWVNYYVIAIPELSGSFRTCVVMGQTIYTSLASAQAEDPAVSISGLSSLTEEFVYLYRMTYQRVSGSSPSNAQLVSVQAIRSNTISVTSGFNPTDHQSLLNRDAVGTCHPAIAVGVDNSGFTGLLSSLPATHIQSALAVIDQSWEINEDFVSTGQTVFALATDITDNHKIKVFVNGRLMREGASYAWTRDSSANSITMSESIGAGSWVHVEIIKR